MNVGVYQELVAHVDKDFNVHINEHGLGYYLPYESSFESDIEDLKTLGATNFIFEKDDQGVCELSYTLMNEKHKLKRIKFISVDDFQTLLNDISIDSKKALYDLNKYSTHKNEYDLNDKIDYYERRMNDMSLTHGQRTWATKRFNELQIN